MTHDEIVEEVRTALMLAMADSMFPRGPIDDPVKAAHAMYSNLARAALAVAGRVIRTDVRSSDVEFLIVLGDLADRFAPPTPEPPP